MARTRTIISGIRTLDDALAAANAGADAVSFTFIRGSARFIEPADAWNIINNLPPLITSIGAFANASLDTFSDIEETCPTTLSQLQGSEDETLVRECGPNVIKAVRYDTATISRELDRWNRIAEVDAVAVELSAAPGLDELAQHLAGIDKPIILSGIPHPSIADAIRILRPWAVDAATTAESDPGTLDASLIEAFCRAVQQADG